VSTHRLAGPADARLPAHLGFDGRHPRSHPEHVNRALSDAELQAYDAPYPSEAFKTGPRELPFLYPRDPRIPGAAENATAWETLSDWERPVLVAFSDGDFQSSARFRQMAGANGQAHLTIANAAHFLTEDEPDALADELLRFVAANPLPEP
jgi:haloalkane dehalogenase